MTQMTPGPLSADILALIAHVTKPLGDVSTALKQQAEAATIVRYSPTMLDVTVPPETAGVDLPDGPTEGQALVYDGEQLVGEVLVWIRSGRLIGLEQAWYTEEPPTSWPPPDRVRVT